MTRLSLVLAVATGAALAGCGGGSTHRASTGSPAAASNHAPASSAPTGAKPDAAAAGAGAVITVRPSEYGRILMDRRGQALYLFTRDGRGPSRCFADCASAWPPVYTTGAPVAGAGLDARKLGTVRRPGGLQVTYGGQPLYRYHADRPARILCQDVREFGGLWLVVKPSGAPVTSGG